MSENQINTTKEVSKFKEDTVNAVMQRVNQFQKSGDIRLPKDYSPENAIRGAWLLLQDDDKKPLEKCTKGSIANALLKMVVWGLSPIKKQCDFIPYGNKLSCNPEYTGNIALAKRYGGLKNITANAIFSSEAKDFQFEVDPKTGRQKVIQHKRTLDSLGEKELAGAYAICEMEDGTFFTEIMNIAQIKASWNQGATKGNSPAHRNFPDQMACKTVINRACKLLIRGSDDSVLMSDNDFDEAEKDVSVENSKSEIQENANQGEEIGFEEVEPETEQPQEKKEPEQKQATDKKSEQKLNF